jgi:hypothetical protein
MDLDLNWRSLSGDMIDLFAGITMIHLPGHTVRPPQFDERLGTD